MKRVQVGAVEVTIYAIAKGYRACWYDRGVRRQKFATTLAGVEEGVRNALAGIKRPLRAKRSEGWRTITEKGFKVKIYRGAKGYRVCWYEGGERQQKFSTK